MDIIKKNLKIREVIMCILFVDSVITYCCFHLDFVRERNIWLVLGVTLKLLVQYLFMFYFWSPIRYEEYNENNPDTGILEWTLVYAVEYIINMLGAFKATIEFRLILQSYILLAFILFAIRYLKVQKKIKEKERFEKQLINDIETIIPLAGMFPVWSMLYVIGNKKLTSGHIILLFSTFILVAFVLTYCMKSISCAHGKKANNRNCVTVIVGSALLILVYFGMCKCRIAWISNFIGIFRIILNVCYIVLVVFLDFLLIYYITTITKRAESCKDRKKLVK